MANANEIILKLTADNQQLKAKLDESKKVVDKTTKDIETSGNKLAGTLKSIGTAVAGYLGVQLIKNLANTAKEVIKYQKVLKTLLQAQKVEQKDCLKQ